MESGNIPSGVSIIMMSASGKFYVSQRLNTKKWPGVWQFAGGHVEKGETPLDAAVRELQEETGIMAVPARLTFLGNELLTGYENEAYMGFRYGLTLYSYEAPICTEPDKATPWILKTQQEVLQLEMLQGTHAYVSKYARCIVDACLVGRRNAISKFPQHRILSLQKYLK